jgi:hypothetical protein
MIETVSSKFAYAFWIKVIFFTIVASGLTATVIMISIKNWTQLKSPDLPLTILVLFLVYGFFIRWAYRAAIRIIATPGGLIIRHLVTKKQTIIAYADIVHVGNTRVNVGRSEMRSYSYLKLVIELRSGEVLNFLAEDFDNYDEVKEAIRRFRFHLN